MSTVLAPRRFLAGDDLVGFATALAGSVALPPPDVTAARQYELIWFDQHINAWAIRWHEDADTGFHDHDGSAAGIVVLEGSIVEERLVLGGPPLARRFGAGRSFPLPAAAIHRVLHGGGGPALTVHAYSPPLLVQGVYHVAADGALERSTTPYTEELRNELARPPRRSARPSAGVRATRSGAHR